MTSLFVWGSAGTGKTLMLMEALKIKLSKLLSQGRKVRVLATAFYYESELRKKFRDKYLVNMKNIEVMWLSKLCDELNIKYNYDTPLKTVNRVIRSLSDSSDDTLTLLLIDEVKSCSMDQPEPDWRDLLVIDNVILLLGLSPNANLASSTEVLPPENNSVLTRHLVHKHRNCPQIRNVIKTINTQLLIWNIYLILVLLIIAGHSTSIGSHIMRRMNISPWMLTKSYQMTSYHEATLPSG